jgi:SulP family sulfate permease
MSELEAQGRVFEDTDTALATAEAELLARLGCAGGVAAELRIGQFEALQDMTAAELAVLEASLQTQRFEPYDVIIKAGSHERDVFFLSSGQASVYASKQGKASRFISWQAGIVFGESAFFTGRVRSADIVADAPTVVFKLSEAAFERLSRESAPVAIKLLRGLGSGLASHLASTTQLVHELES